MAFSAIRMAIQPVELLAAAVASCCIMQLFLAVHVLAFGDILRTNQQIKPLLKPPSRSCASSMSVAVCSMQRRRPGF